MWSERKKSYIHRHISAVKRKVSMSISSLACASIFSVSHLISFGGNTQSRHPMSSELWAGVRPGGVFALKRLLPDRGIVSPQCVGYCHFNSLQHHKTTVSSEALASARVCGHDCIHALEVAFDAQAMQSYAVCPHHHVQCVCTFHATLLILFMSEKPILPHHTTRILSLFNASSRPQLTGICRHLSALHFSLP